MKRNRPIVIANPKEEEEEEGSSSKTLCLRPIQAKEQSIVDKLSQRENDEPPRKNKTTATQSDDSDSDSNDHFNWRSIVNNLTGNSRAIASQNLVRISAFIIANWNKFAKDKSDAFLSESTSFVQFEDFLSKQPGYELLKLPSNKKLVDYVSQFYVVLRIYCNITGKVFPDLSQEFATKPDELTILLANAIIVNYCPILIWYLTKWDNSIELAKHLIGLSEGDRTSLCKVHECSKLTSIVAEAKNKF